MVEEAVLPGQSSLDPCATHTLPSAIMASSKGEKSAALQDGAESSRLIVKNIPKHISESRLREHFQQNGAHVTDVKIITKADGNSRQFAFVGFTSPADAGSAMKFFDRTFLDTSRIFVKYALPKGDNRIDRPWSRHSEGSSRFEQARKDKDEEKNKKRPSSEITKAADAKTTPEMSEAKKRKLDEFLGVSGKKGKLWANDDGFGFDIAQADKKKKPTANDKKEDKKNAKKTGKPVPEDGEAKAKAILKAQESDDDSDEDDYQDFPSQKKKSSNGAAEPESDGDDESDMDGSDEEILDEASLMEVDEKPAPKAEEKEEEEEKNSKKGKKADKKVAERKKYRDLDQTVVSDTGRLFVRNLPFTASEDDVRTLFSRFGNVSEVHLSIDKLSKRSKGFGFVTFHFPAHAIEAAKQLDAQFFQGRILHVLPAMQQEAVEGAEASNGDVAPSKPARGPGPQLGSPSGFVSEFQKKKQEKQKELANQDFNWNTLFIRPDAVASAMATNLQVSKSDLLDLESTSSMAVRLALGETNIIKETKDFLASEGVHLDALKGHYNKAITRSSTIIIAKNIPTNTQIEEMRNVFGRFGTLVKVVMPPSRTVSLIEFTTPQEARAAFKHLAYKQFKDAPLFLEWAPTGVFGEEKKEENGEEDAAKVTKDTKGALKELKETISKSSTDSSTRSAAPADVKAAESTISSTEPSTESASKKDKKSKSETKAEESSSVSLGKMGSMDAVLEEASLTLFVKNLSFATSEESLKTLVDRMLGEVNNVSIAMHKVKGEMMSQGYGFIECKSREQAVKAWKQLQGSMLDGHQLQVSFSAQRKAGASVSLAELQQMASKRKDGPSGQIQASTKIMVKNVPFEATRNEIRDLFTPFGELKSVRLPNKAGGKGHRGFAFVEYVTPDEAAAAIDALGTTHLYNRRLVIDYAEQDGDVEQIRAKTAAQFEQ